MKNGNLYLYSLGYIVCVCVWGLVEAGEDVQCPGDLKELKTTSVFIVMGFLNLRTCIFLLFIELLTMLKSYLLLSLKQEIMSWN